LAWTPTAETIATLAVDQIKNLRKNAEDRQLADIVALCDTELERRKPVKVKKEKVAKVPKEPKPPKEPKAPKAAKKPKAAAKEPEAEATES
jgi:hypothetical protein